MQKHKRKIDKRYANLKKQMINKKLNGLLFSLTV